MKIPSATEPAGIRLNRYRYVNRPIAAKCDLTSALTAQAEHGGRIEQSWVVARWDGTEELGAWSPYRPEPVSADVEALAWYASHDHGDGVGPHQHFPANGGHGSHEGVPLVPYAPQAPHCPACGIQHDPPLHYDGGDNA